MNWFAELVEQIKVMLPNMPTSYIENAVVRSARTFFRETQLLKDDAYMDASCNLSDFVIDLPDGRTIVQAKQLAYHTHPDDAPLLNSTWRTVCPAPHRNGYGWWLDLQGSQPTVAVSPEFVISQGRYCITYSWTPDTKQCELPHHFVGKYFDALEAGALAYLFKIPTEADTQNFQLAQYYERAYQNAIDQAGAEETQNHSDRPIYMRAQSFI